MRVNYADGVFQELVSLSFYIAEDNEKIAERFLDACDLTFRFLADNPLIGSIRHFRNAKLSGV